VFFSSDIIAHQLCAVYKPICKFWGNMPAVRSTLCDSHNCFPPLNDFVSEFVDCLDCKVEISRCVCSTYGKYSSAEIYVPFRPCFRAFIRCRLHSLTTSLLQLISNFERWSKR